MSVNGIRSLKRLAARDALQKARYLPMAVLNMQSWLPYFVDYVGLGRVHRTYVFRNGLRIATHDKMDTATIGVIFLRKDYGEIDEARVIVDVGANIGVFTLYAATRAPGAVVYAYEPVASNFEMLQRNIACNGLASRVRPFALGVAAQREIRTLYLSDLQVGHTLFSRGREHQAVTIDCIGLRDVFDDNGLEQIDLLKLDCEGAEYECLYNTPVDYLARIRRIRLEYHGHVSGLANGNTVDQLAQYLRAQGFCVRRLQPEAGGRGMLWVERSGLAPAA